MGRFVLSIVAASALLSSVGLAADGEKPAFVVIVHAGNPAGEMSTKALSRLFLKKVTKWPGSDTKVVPADQVYTYEVVKEVCSVVHEKTVAWLRSYWRKQVFSGRGYPPPQLKSDDAVIEHVKGSEGGVGYVAGDATLPDGVKPLTVVQE